MPKSPNLMIPCLVKNTFCTKKQQCSCQITTYCMFFKIDFLFLYVSSHCLNKWWTDKKLWLWFHNNGITKLLAKLNNVTSSRTSTISFTRYKNGLFKNTSSHCNIGWVMLQTRLLRLTYYEPFYLSYLGANYSNLFIFLCVIFVLPLGLTLFTS